MHRSLLLGLLIACVVACTARNPDWCDSSNPCGDGRFCDTDGDAGGLKNTCIAVSPVDAGVPCPDAGTCPTVAPVCRKGLCARCTVGEGVCPDPTRPVCRTDGTCGPCANGDCPGMLCAPSGACVDCLGAGDCPTPTKPVCTSANVCGACTKDVDCNLHAGTPHCSTAGVCVECRNSMDCTSIAAPHCGTASTCGPCGGDTDCSFRPGTTHCGSGGSCVECRSDQDCPTARPVCAPNATCQPCTSDSECPDLCDADSGTCVPADDILFVSAGGTGDCSRDAPCGAIQTALDQVVAGTKTWIKAAPGMYLEALVVNGIAVEIVGPGVTVLPRAAGLNLPGALVENGASATFRGLYFAGASGGTSADGVLCSGSVGAPTRVTLRQSTLDGNGQYGLDAMNCVVTVERSLVTRNAGGGVALFASDFTLVNNFIVNNGLPATAPFGGVNIARDPPSGAAAGVLAFNTIARNTEPGVKCSDQVTTLTFADDIVANNGTNAQVVNSGAKCQWRYSDITPMPPGGTGNIGKDPMFVDPQANDYHLAAGSPCVNTADPAATVNIDFDGDSRPAQGRADMGADEVVP